MLGKTVAQYQIESELGKGGMGVVYRARETRLGRTVALKILRERFAEGPEQRELILAEARAAAALNHPGVTTIYEVGEYNGGLFIAMELVVGSSLRELLKDGPFQTRRLLRIATEIAEASEAAHSQGVVHGDIKPENIAVQPSDRTKLLDFGLARQIDKLPLTSTAAATTLDWNPRSDIAGTLAYMAPEQLQGEQRDQRADLFSLGVVLYELATGQRPFSGSNATELIAQILTKEVMLREERGVPSGLAHIICRLLEKKAGQRHQSAHELLVDLTNLLRQLERGETPSSAVTSKPAIAILPSKLLTPNAEDEYLSVALADALIHALAEGGELLVRPTSTVEKFAKQMSEPLLAGRELDVQIVAHGSIQKTGARMRVHIQVWNTADGAATYSAKHDAEIGELFALQDEMAAGLQRAMGLSHKTARPDSGAPPTENSHAYELFLRAAERLARLNRWDTRTAIEMLEQAVKLDPQFADAWARLAEACVLIGTTQEPQTRWLRRAGQAIHKALALNRHNAEAHCARGRLLWTPAQNFKNRPALRALKEALQINPGCHAAQIWRCLILLHLGLHAEARRIGGGLGRSPRRRFHFGFYRPDGDVPV